MFEAGALSKSVDQSKVIPLLIDCLPSQIPEPLVQFQSCNLNEQGIRKILELINGINQEESLSDQSLNLAFEKWWPDLMSKIDQRFDISEVGVSNNQIREPQELLEEILQLSREIARNQSQRVSDRTMEWLQRTIGHELDNPVELNKLDLESLVQKLLSSHAEWQKACLMAQGRLDP
jgi:hypothetical protein